MQDGLDKVGNKLSRWGNNMMDNIGWHRKVLD